MNKGPKLITASYFQEENHGPGRKIGISPGKPNQAQCDLRFEPLDPGELYWDYHKEKKIDPKAAGENFISGYRAQCQAFVNAVKDEVESTGKSVFEILPFKEGDNLLSWENKGNTTYRAIAAEYLRELGYEVEEN